MLLAFVALVATYFVSFGSQGWHPTDYEYVMGTVWRVVNGEVPYRDFIYHKPPFTLFLHTVWFLLPDGWAVKASRLFFYVQMAFAAALPILWAQHRKVIASGFRVVFLGISCLVLALHNFPAMPWQTTDGIFFDVLGAVLFLESISVTEPRRILGTRAAASACLALALLSKQNFFAPCLLLGLYALVEFSRTRSRSVLAASAVPALALLLGAALYLKLNGALPQYLAQFQSQSTGSVFLELGLKIYLRSEDLWTLIPFSFLPLVRVLDSESSRWRAIAARLLGLAVPATLALLTYRLVPYDIDRLGMILFFALLGTLLGRLAVLKLAEPRMLQLHVFFVVLSWSCTLSLGYHTPLLGLAGLGLVLHGLLPPERDFRLDLPPVIAMAVLVCSSFWQLCDNRPYRDERRSDRTEDLGTLFPRLDGIRTNPGTFARYLELKQLITRHAASRPFVVLQDYPGIHWLLGARNPIGLDWVYPPEPDGFEDPLYEQLQRSGAIAIIPKEVNARWLAPGSTTSCDQEDFHAHNLLSQAVARQWRLLESGPFFCVYAGGEPDP